MLLSSSATTKRYNFILWISLRGTTDRPTLVSNTLKPFTNLSFHSVFSDAAWFKRKLLISAFKYRAICCTVHRSSLIFVDCFWIKFCRWYHVHLTDFLTAAHSEHSKKHLNLQDLVFNSPYWPLYILFKLCMESLLSRQLNMFKLLSMFFSSLV